MSNQSVINHRYTIGQARLLLDILKHHSAESLLATVHHNNPKEVDEALNQLRLELKDFIDSDDGLGLIVPSRDEKGLM